MNNIIIVGGGTAGWLSALFAKKYYKDYNIILVESTEIGILGAGEGSVPFLVDFLNLIDVEPMEVIKRTKGTLKNGIVFDDWNGDGTAYCHMFTPVDEAKRFAVKGVFSADCKSHFFNKLVAEGVNFEENLFGQKLTLLHKSPFILERNDTHLTARNELYFSLHFDARLLADYLKEISLSRGVQLYDDKLSQIITDDEGYISQLKFESGLSLDTAFVYDCTGLRREIIGKFYKSEWKDYSKHLPCDSAIPFFPDMDESIPPYTLSKALKYGWMWKIPLQHRYGAGYVFDSKQISQDDAKKELDELMGYEVQSPRTFKFKPGSFKRTWIKNCIAIGLASGFIEPLEATAIWVAAATLDHSLRYFVLSKDRNMLEPARERFNKTMEHSNDKILDFIYLHYITKRRDTPFWRDFMKINKPTEGVMHILDEISKGPLDTITVEKINTLNYHIMKWTHGSYMEICNGLHLLDRKFAKNYADNYKTVPSLEEYIRQSDAIIDKMIDHKDFLKAINIYNP